MARKTTKKTRTRSAPAARKKKTSSKRRASATKKKSKSASGRSRSKATGGRASTKKGKRVAGGKAASARKTTRKKTGSTAAGKKKTAKTGSARGSRAKSGSRKAAAEAPAAPVTDPQGYVFVNGRRVRMISTKGVAKTKKRKQSTAAAASTDESADAKPAKPVKSPLTKKQLGHYRSLLLLKRAELVGDLDSLEKEALRSNGGNLSHMPIHMADIGTDAYDQDFMLGLASSERQLVREIDDALRRIEDHTYGVCLMTGKPIPKARLEAKPWAKYTIEAARLIESGQGR